MKLTSLMARTGMTDVQIARAVGVHCSTVGRWRKGTVEPSEPGTIAILARVLACTPADIRPDLAALFNETR